jgi:hypothetical protein
VGVKRLKKYEGSGMSKLELGSCQMYRFETRQTQYGKEGLGKKI